MNPSITIREAVSADKKVLTRIIRDSFRDVAERFSLTPQNCPRHPSNYTVGWIEADMIRGVEYFILSQKDQPVGCVGLERPGPDLCYLERLSVLPRNRHKGFGRALARHVMELAKAGETNKISIGIIANQTELADWYADLGFVTVGTKTFPQLPFEVLFMEFAINNNNGG